MSMLEMVQNILSAIDSDEINAIGDTIESVQVAEVIKETYYELFSNTDIPTFKGLVKLDAGADILAPTKLLIPDLVKDIEWIKYNWHQSSAYDFRDVAYVKPSDFIQLGVQRASGSQTGTVTVNGPNNSQIVVLNNYGPTYWTTFNNNEIYLDAYFSSLESTVETSNTLCFGQYEQAFTLNDSFIPLLDTNLFPLLLAEAKSVCFVNLKQVSSQKEEQRSRRLQVSSQNDAWRANQRDLFDKYPNYSRKRGTQRIPKTALIGR